MNDSSVKVLAATLIGISLVKLVVVFRNPKAWIGFARRLYANPALTSGVALTAGATILFLLIRSGLDVVQILAVCLFVVCLIVVGVAPYAQHLFEWLATQDLKQLIRRQWLYIAVWVLLLAWGTLSLLV